MKKSRNGEDAPREWFAVRCFVCWTRPVAPAGEPTQLYEERITMWRARDVKHAMKKAKKELEHYWLFTDERGWGRDALI